MDNLWILRRVVCTGWGQGCGQKDFFPQIVALTCCFANHTLWRKRSFSETFIHSLHVDNLTELRMQGDPGPLGIEDDVMDVTATAGLPRDR
ncbi:hypothetical protein [Arthrobacter russicus]|uniref:hypothetical protein n=1 Tax=Arthrobacter russicus TaxID=172040 RepID=UPI00286A1F97|nr:hypothetical protein [Arthrobacter russicus]